MKALLTILLLTLLAGCAGRPKHYAPPDASAVIASSRRLATAVDSATRSAERAAVAVESAKAIAQRESALGAEAQTKLATLLRVTPPELQPLVDEIKAKVDELSVEHENMIARIEDAGREHATLRQQLHEAQAAKAQFASDAERYLASAQKLADDASRENARALKAEKALSWYRWRWWGSWIVLGLGVVACGIVGFLKFTGRLAIGASRAL